MFIRYCFLPAGVSLELIRLGSGSGIQGGKNTFFSGTNSSVSAKEDFFVK